MKMYEDGTMPLWEVGAWLIKRLAVDSLGTIEFTTIPEVIRNDVIQQILEFENSQMWLQSSSNRGAPEDYAPHARYVRDKILTPLGLI
jgi:hypothetical protein